MSHTRPVLHRLGRQPSPTGWQWLLSDQQGSATAELVVITPIVILMLLFVVLCGRLADTDLRLNDAAHQAARAATIARSPATAVSDATTTAHAALDQAGVACQSLTLQADTQGLRPGSTVTVTVSCILGLSDLTLLGVPGTITRQASFSSVVDVYRGTTATLAGGLAP